MVFFQNCHRRCTPLARLTLAISGGPRSGPSAATGCYAALFVHPVFLTDDCEVTDKDSRYEGAMKPHLNLAFCLGFRRWLVDKYGVRRLCLIQPWRRTMTKHTLPTLPALRWIPTP